MNKHAFVILVGTMFISMLGMGIVSPFLPIYADTLGASSLDVGLVQAAFNISSIATLLFVGRLSDRYGRKSFLSAGLFILTVSSVGLMFANDPLHLILWRLVQGLGASAHLPIAQAYLGDITPEGGEGKWMGYFNAVLFAGIGAGPLAGGIITDAFNIKTTFLVMAVLNVLGLVATLIFLKEMPRKTAVQKHQSIIAPLKSRILRGVFIYRLSTGIGTASLMAFMPLYADQKIMLSATLIGILLASRTPVSILQSYTGRLADRWDRRSMVLGGSIISVIALALLPLTVSFWSLLAIYVSIAVGQAFGVPAATAYVVNEGRIYGMGSSMTMFMMAMQMGNGIGPIALGGISDWLGLNSVFYTAAACTAIGLALFIRMVPSTGQARHHRDATP